MEKANTDFQFLIVYPTKMRVLPLILIATWLNSLKMNMKLRINFQKKHMKFRIRL